MSIEAADDPAPSARLDRPVDPATDHVLGPQHATIQLVEYGSYACPHCRAANERISDVRDEFAGRLLYVFRHRPLTGHPLARRAAELAERASTSEQFWRAHMTLMTRSQTLTEDDLRAVEHELDLTADADTEARAKARVEADERSAAASGVRVTPTFFIGGRRYDGAWDTHSFADAMAGRVGHRLRNAALDFASWTPSAGALLLLASVLAIALTNSPWGPWFTRFWEQDVSLAIGASAFALSLLDWINHGLLAVFFLVVGLEIKREFTIGTLANARSAALPIAAALGGMAAPAGLYALILPTGPLAHGWGVPMATDTAFAVALIAMLGRRVPVDLRIFLTAATIIDDIGAITVVAIFYTDALHLGYLTASVAVTGLLVLLNQWHVYRVGPYLALGLLLWFCVHEAGLHATIAGVVLAVLIPTRPPSNLAALMAQAGAIADAGAPQAGEVLRHRLSAAALRALDAIHDRLESPADRLLRHIEPWSAYFVLPIFALANAGVVIGGDGLSGHGTLMAAIVAGLVIGKPVGMTLAAWLAVRLRLGIKPEGYSWSQLAGAGALSGIGFTMSLFIAGQAFPASADFAAAKIAVFVASLVAAALGVSILWRAGRARAG
jgi:NhaA family Na+:H+ antiporter